MSGLVLFDFDGTLVDTAPDLCAAANHLRTRQELAPKPFVDLREFSGKGARGLIRASLGIEETDPSYPELKDAFLSYYFDHLADGTRPFEGILPMLKELGNAGFSWGIVTNKHTRLARPIFKKLFASDCGCACLVGSDTTGKMKPDPAPLLYGMQAAGGFKKEETVYVGDDARDMCAAQAAGICGVAAAWGYTGGGSDISEWGAAAIARTPKDLVPAIRELIRS